MDMCKRGKKQTGVLLLISLLPGAEAVKHRVTSTAPAKSMNWPKMMMMCQGLSRLQLYGCIRIDAAHLKGGCFTTVLRHNDNIVA